MYTNLVDSLVGDLNLGRGGVAVLSISCHNALYILTKTHNKCLRMFGAKKFCLLYRDLLLYCCKCFRHMLSQKYATSLINGLVE